MTPKLDGRSYNRAGPALCRMELTPHRHRARATSKGVNAMAKLKVRYWIESSLEVEISDGITPLKNVAAMMRDPDKGVTWNLKSAPRMIRCPNELRVQIRDEDILNYGFDKDTIEVIE